MQTVTQDFINTWRENPLPLGGGQFIVKETTVFIADITKTKIRNSFSHVASNSFVKCKKKIEVEASYDPHTGRKSLWHSLRIVDFGIQILKHDKIIDYSSVNYSAIE